LWGAKETFTTVLNLLKEEVCRCDMQKREKNVGGNTELRKTLPLRKNGKDIRGLNGKGKSRSSRRCCILMS